MYSVECRVYSVHCTVYSAASREDILEGVNRLARRYKPILHTSLSRSHVQHSTFHIPHFVFHTPHSTLHTPHSILHSPWFGFPRDFSSLLGGVTRNSSGQIVAATTTLMVLQLQVPQHWTLLSCRRDEHIFIAAKGQSSEANIEIFSCIHVV